MKAILALLTLFLLTPLATAASLETSSDDEACRAGPTVAVGYWDVTPYSGTCVGVVISLHDDAPMTCREPDLPPCGLVLVIG